jgi:hypothetical protein
VVKAALCIANGLASALVGLLWMASVANAVSSANFPADRVEAVIEPSAATIYTGEMVLLKVHTILFGKTVALEELKQPALQNFAWIQLSPDRWPATEIDGVQALRFERVLALFPTRSGSLTIDPFVHHLTLVDADNIRRTVDLQSTPVEVDVEPWPAAQAGQGAGDSWWLPARSFNITDKWEEDPDRIPTGETVRRTVTIEAVGLTAERLPPPPKLRSPGVITFARPVERKTLLSPAGPVAHAIYSWDVRPASQEAATLQALQISWFDTASRRMREATLQARRIAFARPQTDSSLYASANTSGFLVRSTWYLSALGGFVVGLVIVLIDRKEGREPSRALTFAKLQAWRRLGSLRRVARLGDAYRFRVVVCELARRDPQRSRIWLATPPVSIGLTALDLYLFGPTESERPDLNVIYAAIRSAWLSFESDAVDPIAVLDAPTSAQQARGVEVAAATSVTRAAMKMRLLITTHRRRWVGTWR